MLAIMHRVEQVVVWIGLLAGWVLLLPIIVSRFYDIIARQYTDAQSTIVQFIEWDAFFLLVCLIFGFAYFRDAHARIDILRERFSARAIAWIEVLGIVFLLAPFCLVCIVYGVEHAMIAYRFEETWWVPFAEGWMRKSIIPLGFSLLLISALVIMLRNVVFLITGAGQPEPQRPEDDHPGEAINAP
ncbi:MAG: TRAP transporter small permease subunit [Proteobacteria bacterium]|nr:TRAP transporter small permease subunit [Pseudomonadota bacterium]